MPPKWIHWFNSAYDPSFICRQDNHHICGILKNRLYNNTNLLVMGKHIVSKNHLQILINTVSKDKHLLVEGDINGVDKMAFKPVLKISSTIVRDALKMYVPGSDGTTMFLTLISNMYRSLSLPNIAPLDRVGLIWHVIFFLRIWRAWIKDSADYKIKNFVTYNAYASTELNGHSIINMIIKLKKEGCEDLFLPNLCQSQTCEAFFRSARSLTTVYSTVINFSVLDLLHKAKRIELQDAIAAELQGEFVFPRRNKPSDLGSNVLPSIDDILAEVQASKLRAEVDAKKMGMVVIENLCVDLEFIYLKDDEKSEANEINSKSNETSDNEDAPRIELADEPDSDFEKELDTNTELAQGVTAILQALGGSISLKKFEEVKGIRASKSAK